MKCPICKKDIPDGVKFCGQCGSKIPRCPTCGKVIYKRSRFCSQDGTPLPEEVLALLPDGAAPAASHGASIDDAAVAAAISEAFDGAPAPEEAVQEELAEAQHPEAPAEKPVQAEPVQEEPVVAQEPEPPEPSSPESPMEEPWAEKPVQEPPRQRFCLQCGKPVYDGQNLCEACRKPAEPPRRFCPRCGKPVNAGQTLCPECSRAEAVSKTPPKEKRNGLRTVLIIIIIVLLLAIGGVFAWAYFSGELSFTSAPSVSDEETQNSDGNEVDHTASDEPEDSESDPTGTEESEESDSDPESEDGESDPTGTEESEKSDSDPESEDGKSESDTEEPENSESESESESESDSNSGSDADGEGDLVMDMILASGATYFTRADLEGFDADMCRLLRNGIYARHGRKFNDATLQAYFDACDWYTGTIEPDAFDDSVLNDYEIKNLDLVVAYEREMEYRE